MAFDTDVRENNMISSSKSKMRIWEESGHITMLLMMHHISCEEACSLGKFDTQKQLPASNFPDWKPKIIAILFFV